MSSVLPGPRRSGRRLDVVLRVVHVRPPACGDWDCVSGVVGTLTPRTVWVGTLDEDEVVLGEGRFSCLRGHTVRDTGVVPEVTGHSRSRSTGGSPLSPSSCRSNCRRGRGPLDTTSGVDSPGWDGSCGAWEVGRRATDVRMGEGCPGPPLTMALDIAL